MSVNLGGAENVCRFCGKRIGYGLGLAKKKWYHVNEGDSIRCPGPIYPLPTAAKSVTSSPEQEEGTK